MGLLYDNCQRCGHLLSKYSITYCDRCLIEIEKERIERTNKREEVYDKMRKNGMSEDEIEEVDNTINSYFIFFIFYPILFSIFFPSEIEKLNVNFNKYIIGFIVWLFIQIIFFIITKLNRYDSNIIKNGSTEFQRKYLELNREIMNPILIFMFIKALFILFR
ncbi:hypothetical protein [Flavobacterium nitratireducens]|uniref:hypothetical protein n=1 Tax=Flavobacterium nitratireducens TaxID=992289 RepID=UPI00241572B7|nr:hypothetical protein [Flavobacterium nitratireducens]